MPEQRDVKSEAAGASSGSEQASDAKSPTGDPATTGSSPEPPPAPQQSVKKRVTIIENRGRGDNGGDANNGADNGGGTIVASSSSKVKIDLKSGKQHQTETAAKLPTPTFKVCSFEAVDRRNECARISS